MRIARFVCLAAGLALPACLETEEEIEVAADGSLTVEVSVEGDGRDVADGYPLPAGPGWTAADGATRAWRDAMASGLPDAWEPPLDDDGEAERVELRASGRFASAADLPELYAPEADPYAAAFQRRSTALDVRQVGASTVYSFERTFHGRDLLYRMSDEWMERRLDDLPDSIKERDDDEPLTTAQWAVLVEALQDCFRHAAGMVVREAMAPAFGVPGAGLAPRAAQRIAEEAADAAAAELRVEAFVAHDLQRLSGDVPEDSSQAIDDADRRAREAVRALLARRLDAEGVVWDVRNAVLQRLEQLLVGWDQADDLRDETFKLHVRMPGVVVGGNFQERDGTLVSWTIEGEDLLKGDARLTVVSVVDGAGR